MECGHHPFHKLFKQLGLPSDNEFIAKFCAEHTLDDDVRLPDADFWTPEQAKFLRDAWTQDADWILIIDRLNVALHH